MPQDSGTDSDVRNLDYISRMFPGQFEAKTQPDKAELPPDAKPQQFSPQSTGNMGGPPPYPAPPNLKNAPEAPKAPDDNPFAAFKDPAIVLAGLGSLFTRRSLTTAFNSAAGAMEGYRSGQKQAFDQKKEAFDEAIKQTIDQNNIELTKYKEAWERRDKSVRDAFANLYAQSAANSDPVMQAALQSGNTEMVEKIITAREAAQTRLQSVIEAAEAKQEIAARAQPSIFPQGLQTMVDQYLAGDRAVLQNLGRGTQGSANIAAFRNLLADTMAQRGITGAQQAKTMAEYAGIVAGERTLGTYGAKLGQASKAVDFFADQALDASKALPRGEFVPANKAIQAYQANTSDPRLYDLGFALMSLVNAYARAINPQGVPRIQDKEHATQFLSTATSPEALERVIARLKLETEAERKATEAEKSEMRGNAAPVKVTSPDEAHKLAPGTHYLTPDGQEYVR